MKTRIVSLVLVAFLAIGCGAAIEKTIVKSVIDAGLASCIAENPGADEPTLHEVCKWTEAFGPEIQALLASQKKGLVKMGVAPRPTSALLDAGKGKD